MIDGSEALMAEIAAAAGRPELESGKGALSIVYRDDDGTQVSLVGEVNGGIVFITQKVVHQA